MVSEPSELEGPDPRQTGAEILFEIEDDFGAWLRIWSLADEEIAFEFKRSGRFVIRPDDVISIEFGGIGAAVGAVPLTVLRLRADRRTIMCSATLEGFMADRSPEEIYADLNAAVAELAQEGRLQIADALDSS